MKCMYCQRISINYEMYVVRQATKPKGKPHRWAHIGHCCDDCEAIGKPIAIEYAPSQTPKVKEHWQ